MRCIERLPKDEMFSLYAVATTLREIETQQISIYCIGWSPQDRSVLMDEPFRFRAVFGHVRDEESILEYYSIECFRMTMGKANPWIACEKNTAQNYARIPRLIESILGNEMHVAMNQTFRWRLAG